MSCGVGGVVVGMAREGRENWKRRPAPVTLCVGQQPWPTHSLQRSRPTVCGPTENEASCPSRSFFLAPRTTVIFDWVVIHLGRPRLWAVAAQLWVAPRPTRRAETSHSRLASSTLYEAELLAICRLLWMKYLPVTPSSAGELATHPNVCAASSGFTAGLAHHKSQCTHRCACVACAACAVLCAPKSFWRILKKKARTGVL